MKVLFLGKQNLYQNGGGDMIQIDQTAKELRRLGVEVDIKTDLDTDFSGYDVVHIFQLDWGYEVYYQAVAAKKAGKPIVLSPIHHQSDEVKRYDDEYVFDYRRLTKYMFSTQFGRDTYKLVYRAIFDPSRIGPTIETVFKGMKNMHKTALQLSDVVLVQTGMEADDLKKVYGVDFKWKKATNGVGYQFLHLTKSPKNKVGLRDYVISVGRLEPRKNHLSLIKAISELRREGLDLNLVLIGKKVFFNHVEYTLRINTEIKKNPWIKYFPYVPYAEMPDYYRFAKVGVSVSWFESTGLTLLEALFCGANVVSTSRPTREYLGDYAVYCDPGDIKSIKNAVKEAYFAKRPVLDPDMKEKYTWKTVAEKTLEVYKEVLGK